MKWALIGASNIARAHMIGALRGQGGDIVSVVSGSAAHGRAFADEAGIAHATTSLDEVLGEGTDAVYISSTNEKHLPQALAAISAGKHVLCEKPLAMSVAEAAQMVRAADQAGVVLATNHHLRCAASHIAIRRIIRAGRIGKVLSAQVSHAVALPAHLQGWRINDAAAGGGVIADITVHDADTIRFHLDEDPAEVVAIASGGVMGRGVEDSVMSVWSMPSGVMVQAHESFTHRFAGTGIAIHGTEGSVIARGVMTQRPVGEVVLRSEAGDEAIGWDAHDLYAYGVARFMDAVAGRGAPAADGRDGLKSLAVAQAVAGAAATGRRSTVDYGGI
ncbi:MAG: Gfo/Idh/MocA family oxidoreductase [Paracoccus sp. (in: a-proteobacteria)]|nr:Gfo/Idh/MocA family oxidoreductase [Paracoccus sp. (in: a-proteobacteria)]